MKRDSDKAQARDLKKLEKMFERAKKEVDIFVRKNIKIDPSYQKPSTW